MSNYLIELSAIHIALLLGYWFLLRKERQYAAMRGYLIASAILALCIPLLKLPKLLFHSNEPIAVPVEDFPQASITIAPAADTSVLTYDVLLAWLSVAISLFFLFKFLSGVGYMIRLAHKSSGEKFNGLHIRRMLNIKGSFSSRPPFCSRCY